MNDRIKIRRPPSRPKKPRCVVCGNAVGVENHHVGGRYHIAWFTIPLCRNHHVRLTRAIRQAGIEMSFTPDIRERFARARMTTFVFLWLLDEALKDHEQREKQR